MNKKNIYSNRKKRFDFILEKVRQQRLDDNFGLKWTLKAILISFLFLGIFYYFAELEKNPKLFTVNEVIKKTGIRSKLFTLRGNKNILVLGVDSNIDSSSPFFATRSDTMLLVSIDRRGDSINIISIPRDSKVYINGGKIIDKINAAHAYGGPDLAVKTVENTLGIEVNNYIVLNYAGLKDFVRILNGIPIEIEKRLFYRDRTADLLIDLQPGYQTLGPKEVEGYIRFRNDPQADIGRIGRQQKFLTAALNRLKSKETVLKIPELIEAVTKNVRTDLNFFEISNLLNIARNINVEDIKITTLPGRPSTRTNLSYWILDADQTQKVIDRYIYRDDPEQIEQELTVSLFYSSDFSDKIQEITENLHENGFNVKFRSQEENNNSQIIAHTKKATLNQVEVLRNKVSELKNSQYFIELDESLYPYTDFTIILSSNQNR